MYSPGEAQLIVLAKGSLLPEAFTVLTVADLYLGAIASATASAIASTSAKCNAGIPSITIIRLTL